MHIVNLGLWLLKVSQKFSLRKWSPLCSQESISILTNYLAHILKIKTSLLIIHSTWLKFCFGTLARFKAVIYILQYIPHIWIFMQIFKAIWSAQGQMSPNITVSPEEMFLIKLNGLLLERQIFANLIKINLINISNNFWAWLFTAKETTVCRSKINSPWLGLWIC